MSQRFFSKLLDRIGDIERGQDDTHRRIANVLRPGRVLEVDAAKGMVKVAYALDQKNKDVATNWVPYATRAGKVRDWNMPVVGEQVTLYSPSGEIGDNSWVMDGGFSNDFPANHDVAGERKISVGDKTWLLLKDNAADLIVDGAKIQMTPDQITIEIGSTKITATGSSLDFASSAVTFTKT